MDILQQLPELLTVASIGATLGILVAALLQEFV